RLWMASVPTSATAAHAHAAACTVADCAGQVSVAVALNAEYVVMITPASASVAEDGRVADGGAAHKGAARNARRQVAPTAHAARDARRRVRAVPMARHEHAPPVFMLSPVPVVRLQRQRG